MVKIDFTLKKFPATGALKERCGLPFGCVFQPYSKLNDGAASADKLEPADVVARCTKCYAYINCYSSLDPYGWTCSLCGHHMEFKNVQTIRYNARQPQRQTLPELNSDVFEVLMGEAHDIMSGAEGISGPAPVYLALIDTAGGEDFLELVRSSLLAALEALPPTALLGIITFSNKLGLHDVKAAVPTARYIPIYDSQPLLVPLRDMMPLHALLAPVGAYKDSFSTLLESITPEQSFDRTRQDASSTAADGMAGAPPAAAPGQQDPMRRGTTAAGRGLGPALLAVLEYLRGLQSAPFLSRSMAQAQAQMQTAAEHLPGLKSPAKIMMFLSGVPDLGAGRLVNPRRRRTRSAAAMAGPPPALAPPPLPEAAAPPSAMQPPLPVPPVSVGGPGSIALQMQGMGLEEDPMEDVRPEARMFYEQAAVVAASLGVCCDLYVVSPTWVGLRLLEPLANSTGGALMLYPSSEDSALPQDVYRRLSSLYASGGILRLRTSPELKVLRHYGRLYADPHIDNLHHIINCDVGDTFAVDFDYTSAQGFLQQDAMAPTIQVAFQYSVVVPCSTPPGQQALQQGGPVRHCVLERRLRVATFKMQVARDPLEVYSSAHPDAVASLLMHKIMRAAKAEGAGEARLLLRDWLVLLSLNFHRNMHPGPGTTPEALLQMPVDLLFSSVDALQPIPRLVYALLRSPLLAPPADGQHPDLTAFLTHLWSCLPPQELARAVYPLLSSWSDPDNMALPRHSLSRAALTSSPAPIYLMDAYIVVVVYYTAAAAAQGMAFPPPQQSALRKAIAALRTQRRITPMVKMVREGTSEADLFHQLLLDEPEPPTTHHARQQEPGATADGSSGSAGGSSSEPSEFGLVQFLDHIKAEVLAQLRSYAHAYARAMAAKAS